MITLQKEFKRTDMNQHVIPMPSSLTIVFESGTLTPMSVSETMNSKSIADEVSSLHQGQNSSMSAHNSPPDFMSDTDMKEMQQRGAKLQARKREYERDNRGQLALH